MNIVHIDEIRPGMVLAADVRDSNGRFLAGKGELLDESHLRIFRIWGVTEIESENGDDLNFRNSSLEVISEELWEEASEAVVRRMGVATADEHPASSELRRIFTLRTARWLSENPELSAAADGAAAIVEDERAMAAPPMRIDPRRFLDEEVELVSLPAILTQILAAINNPLSSATCLAEIISRDQGLAAKLLKMANSSYFGFPGRVDTISRAVTIVGTNQLSMLAMGAMVVAKVQDIPSDLMDMESYWKHCIACGIGARVLMGSRRTGNPEMYFVAGLLHSLGHLVLMKYFPIQSRYALLESRKRNIPLTVLEKELFGFDHAWFGGAILKRWKFPFQLEQAVRYQYMPLKATSPMDVTMVHIAGILAKGMDPGWKHGYPLPPLDCKAWDLVQLAPSILSPTLNLMAGQVDGMYRMLFDKSRKDS
ncbi:HD-like signal output (HDOD) domain, no enzymatic activity [Desulfonatronum thiosulfatophilum]|uniref:HD-like signal output (HDOD) domain, no enzymatic activity n=1 Tax=Desulfonatronum thiosulfatophilum TaxID=617002 RepID=A0A1G6ETX5_9BACT|nr:HDOD domain-containing protein [Desulfonatronum thiosulfatophilum]SDB60732.1 HD-like signal output (HDOD) domain, no enzymatic activity [Desulfonatronum thiosulfatophilum]